jgi:Protein of unknown function (DUF2958)
MNLKSEVIHRLREHPLYSQEGTSDPIAFVRVYLEGTLASWYLTECDGTDICFGYVTGLAHNEWGYVSLNELAELQGLRVLCDKSFKATNMSKLLLEGKL